MQTTEAVIDRSSTGILRSIRMFWALYMKDLSQLAGICLSLIVLSAVWRTSIIIFENNRLGVSYDAITFMFPAVLAFQLYMNRHNGSVYQQLSLPVLPGISMITTYAAFITYIFLYQFIISAIDAYSMTLSFLESINRLPAEYIARIEIGASANIRRFAVTLIRSNRLLIPSSVVHFYSGIVCLAAGIVGPAAGRFKLQYWAGFIGVILLILGVFALLQRFEIQWYSVFGQFSYLLVGVGFAIIGALLHNKYAEV